MRFPFVYQCLRRLAWIMALACCLGGLAGVPARGQSPVTVTRPITVVVHRHVSFEQNSTNIRIFRWVNNHHTPALDVFFEKYSFLGTGWVLIPVVLFAYFRRRRLLVPLLIAVSVESILVQVLKLVYQQPRPYVLLGPQIHWLIHLRTLSFPSGDAAIAFAIAGVMLDRESRAVQCAWLLYALLIAYERMYVGVHFPLDVTTGALIGLLCARVTLALLQRKKNVDAPAELQTGA